MKKVLLMLVAFAAVTAFAQDMPEADSTPAPKSKQNQQTPAQNSQMQNAAQPGKLLPQAKTQEEYKAFQDTMATIQKGDPAQGEVAADAFAAKFKSSEITPILYHRVLQLYQNDNNADKAIEVGKKILALNPNDPIANVLVASMVSERIRETDLDKEERLAEAEADAKRCLQTVDTEFVANPGTPQERIDASKNMIRSMAYAALANVETVRMNYPAAENYFKQSAALPGAAIDAVTWLRYALLLDKQKKYAEAMGVANKAYDASTAGSQTQELIKKERERLTMLLSNATPASASTPAPKQ
ncbi:MAG TPA: hypothetical protein VLM42_18420 [Bryobacteraceae bacterium]|nr:hypothetical protein [Bryobacteraceae bacterium]